MQFDDATGICLPCLAAEKQKTTNWNTRWKELEELADKYRGMNGDGHDCIIAASGGKDSYYQTYIFKERLGMNPLLVSVDNFSWTHTGKHNWDNMLEEFNVDAVIVKQKPEAQRSMFIQALEKYGSPSWLFDLAIFATPFQESLRRDIPLVIYGEDSSYLYGGPQTEETSDAKVMLTNDVVKPIPWDKWDVEMKDVQPAVMPSDIRRVDARFLSYYVPWDGRKNMEFARQHGLRTLDDTNEWHRDGFLEQYDQIDSVGYLTHTWFKFPKYGHQRVSEVASLEIRAGRMTRKEAVQHVLKEDWKLDRKMLYDFLYYLHYDERKFWDVVERFANKEIVEKRDGDWRLKPETVEDLEYSWKK